MTTEPREWRLWLSIDRAPLTLNGRPHWRTRYRWTKTLRNRAKRLCRDLGVPPLDRPVVELHLIPPNRTRRDADNLVPTAKPCVDGLVDAGVIPDDSPAYVDHRMPVIDEPVADDLADELIDGRLYLLIREAPGRATVE
jgi:crossover junction endodeoxyribonuclease RusA